MATGMSNLGSLTQAARKKELKTAKGILIVVGVLTLLFNLGFVVMAESAVDSEIKKEIKALNQRGLVADPVAVEKIRQQSVRLTQLVNGAGALLGAVFIGLGFAVKTYPIPATVLGLVLYVAGIAIFGFINPASLFQGIIFKILVVVALAKSIQAAIAYEREKAIPPMNEMAMG